MFDLASGSEGLAEVNFGRSAGYNRYFFASSHPYSSILCALFVRVEVIQILTQISVSAGSLHGLVGSDSPCVQLCFGEDCSMDPPQPVATIDRTGQDRKCYLCQSMIFFY